MSQTTIISSRDFSGLAFARSKKWAIVVISILMVVPCVWHRHIEAGDLGSHVYNAWLAQLIEKGQAPGLYMVRQWNNVLVDWLLQHTGAVFGFVAAEKIVASLCVLSFFWGVFSLVAALSEQPPWFIAPCIAMLAYGYSFNMGFLNYYASIGLASLCLAILWKGRGVERVAGVLLVPFILLAHPIGFLWLVATAIYLALWRLIPKWWKLSVPVVALAVLCVGHWYLAHHVKFAVDWEHDPFYVMNGADQLRLYGDRYATLGWIALGFGVICFAVEAISRAREAELWRSLALPAQLYFIALLAVALVPENMHPTETGAWIGLLASRLTTLVAIFGIGVMGCLRPRKWQIAGFGVCAILFFSFLYQDTLILNRLEANAEQLVSGLPPGSRVLSTVFAPPDSRITFVNHIIDRSCVGHCFSYENYEPSSGQFRIRVRPDSPVATTSVDDSEDMQSGGYDVQEEDLPMKEIFQCDPKDLTKLCIRDLASGEQNGRIGYKPASN